MTYRLHDQPCQYCGKKKWAKDQCATCGAPLPDFDLYRPRFIGDYVIYIEDHLESDTLRFRFYLGISFIGDIWISKQYAEEYFKEHGYGIDLDQHILERFETAPDSDLTVYRNPAPASQASR